ACRALPPLGNGWSPPGWHIPFWWIFHKHRGGRNHNQVCDPQNRKGLEYADYRDQSRRNRRCDDRPSPKSCYSQAGDHASLIGERVAQGGERKNVAQSKSEAPEKAIGKIQPPEMSAREAGQEDPASVKNGGGCSYPSWAYFSHPKPACECGKSEHQD